MITKQECAILMAYTGIAMLKGDDLFYFYDYLSGIIGRPVYTHEIPRVVDYYRDTAIRNDFLALCRNAKEDSHEKINTG
ncbi:MAG: hypothetical protein V3G42_12265 [Oscillospiraceae bacterium]